MLAGLLTDVQLRELGIHLQGLVDDAGARVFGNGKLQKSLESGPVGGVARTILGSKARAVRAILFDKSIKTNWALGWHQDRTIVVRERVEMPGFGRWTTKSGMIHVEPPFSIIERMLTARIHFDSVTQSNAPLLVALGSHRFGRIEESEIDAITGRCRSMACLAGQGDVWFYRTSILHASKASRSEARRRVLQLDFSSVDLPGRLEWLGIS